MFKNLTSKKKIIYIVISIILITAIIIGSIFIFKSINNSNRDQTIGISDKPAADKIKKMAIEALDNNITQAKALFQTAKRQYEYIHDNATDTATHDAAQADIIDCEAQLWMIEHR